MRPASHTARWRDDIHGRYAALDRVACATCHTADYCSRCHNELPSTHVPLALFKGVDGQSMAEKEKVHIVYIFTYDTSARLSIIR